MKKIFVNLIVLVGMLVSLLAFSGGAPAYASSDILFNPTSVTFHSQLVLTQESLHAVTVTLTNSTSAADSSSTQDNAAATAGSAAAPAATTQPAASGSQTQPTLNYPFTLLEIQENDEIVDTSPPSQPAAQ